MEIELKKNYFVIIQWSIGSQYFLRRETPSVLRFHPRFYTSTVLSGQFVFTNVGTLENGDERHSYPIRKQSYRIGFFDSAKGFRTEL